MLIRKIQSLQNILFTQDSAASITCVSRVGRLSQVSCQNILLDGTERSVEICISGTLCYYVSFLEFYDEGAVASNSSLRPSGEEWKSLQTSKCRRLRRNSLSGVKQKFKPRCPSALSILYLKLTCCGSLPPCLLGVTVFSEAHFTYFATSQIKIAQKRSAYWL